MCLCQTWINSLDWIVRLHKSTAALVDDLTDEESDASLIDALLDVCADLDFGDLYNEIQKLCTINKPQKLAARKRKLVLCGYNHMANSCTELQTKAEVSWVHGRCPRNKQLRAALAVIESGTASVCKELTELMTCSYLHRWRFNLVFTHLNTANNSKLTALEFERAHRMLPMIGEIANSSSLRLDADKLMISQELNRFTRLIHQGRGKVSTVSVESSLQLSVGNSSFRLMDLQQVHLTAEEESEAIALFSRIDKANEHGVTDGKVTFEELQRALVMMASIKYTEEEITELMTKYDTNNDQTLNLEEFKLLRRELKIPPLAVEDCVLFELSQEQRRLAAGSHRMKAELPVTKQEELRSFFYFVCWVNFLCMALYNRGSDDAMLDRAMVLFSFISCSELLLLMWQFGIGAFFFSDRNAPHDMMQRQGTFVCVLVSVIGSLNLIFMDILPYTESMEA